MNKTGWKIIFVLSGILTFAAGIISIFVLDPANRFANFKVGKNNLPKAFIVQSGSMEPKIKTGGLVLTVPQKNYSIGDVITFSKDGSKKNLITHRINSKQIGNEGLVFTTKGDANEESDTGTVAEKNVVGKVIFHVPYIGYLANFAKEPKGFILMVIVPATIVVYEELKNLLKEALKLFRKRKKKIFVPRPPYAPEFTLPKAAVFVPILGTVLLLVAFSSSFFSDNEKSLQNTLGAAASYEEPQTLNLMSTESIESIETLNVTLTVTPTPTATPSTTETPTPTPTEIPETPAIVIPEN